MLGHFEAVGKAGSLRLGHAITARYIAIIGFTAIFAEDYKGVFIALKIGHDIAAIFHVAPAAICLRVAPRL